MGGDRGRDDFGEELAALREIFRDEAAEALDTMARRLESAVLDAGDLAELMRITHTLKGSAGTIGLGELAAMAHALEERLAALQAGRISHDAALGQELLGAVDAMRARLDAPARAVEVADAVPELVAAADDRLPDPDETVSLRVIRDGDAVAGAGDAVVAAGDAVVAAGDAVVALPAGTWPGPASAPEPRRDGRGVLRVDAARVDALMDSVSELVIDRTRIERRVQSLRERLRELADIEEALGAERAGERPSVVELGHALAERIGSLHRAADELIGDADGLRRTTAGLQESLTRMRMSSAGSLFQVLSRQLRTLAQSAGKRVRMVSRGDDTEFDRVVAERIADPLVQLLRNAVAHGIEDADTRRAAGKPAAGEIRIEARQEGSLLVLEIGDDGAGIDPAALRAHLGATGRWTQAKAALASDAEVLQALFDPGVSTRAQADLLAGRGVGLDMVRATMARLGGEIRLASVPGKGATFTIRVPVSMSMCHAMQLEVSGQVYAVPSVHVVGTMHVGHAGPVPAHVDVHGQPVPLVRLQALLGREEPGAAAPVLVLEYAGRRVAITCDRLLGTREIVVKELGPLLAPLPLYAGATLSATGQVQLILDPAALTRIHDHDTVARTSDRDAPGASAPAPSVPGRALVADDSPAVRQAMAHILERAGYVVDAAEDGVRAWAMALSARYDLVVTDIEMPHMSGFGLIERIRGDHRLARVPIIVVSASDTAENRARAGAQPSTTFMPKPLTPDKLRQALASL